MSARMRSTSATPVTPRMARCRAAMDASVRPISSVAMAGSASIGGSSLAEHG